MAKNDKFKFRNLDNVGAADAADDRSFLKNCFVSTGDLDALRSSSKPQRIILGRTGSGKSALLIRLAEIEPRCIQIQPESLALAYISNSTILNYLSDLGVKLDIFFKLLWRHVFTVELLRSHLNVYPQSNKIGFWDNVVNLVKGKNHTNAVKYLNTWGQSFWEETEYRIKEVTLKLEEDIKASLGAKYVGISADADAAQKMTAAEKQEVIYRAQQVVNKVQIRQLSEIIDLIADVLHDDQKRYYILIDRLDEDWIEDKLRFRLIRSLIETIKDFNKVQNAKIIIAIRIDLIDRVFRLTRDGGFQEEKYESLFLPIQWNRAELIEMLNLRINALVQQRYTRQNVTYEDVLPKDIGRKSVIDYMLERTMMRPRDLILFFNFCIEKAIDRPSITIQMLREAEGDYSRHRLRSLGDEWVADYPNLLDFAKLFKGRIQHFACNDISEEECNEFCLGYLTNTPPKIQDELSLAANRLVNLECDRLDFLRVVLNIFHRVGMIGIKFETYESFAWKTVGRRISPISEIDEQTRIAIQPTFFRVLGIKGHTGEQDDGK